jgi:hypothetical protein
MQCQASSNKYVLASRSALLRRRYQLRTDFPERRGAYPRQLLRSAGVAAVLRACQKSARRHGQPLIDVVIARVLARTAYDLDTATEIGLAHKLVALSECEEVCA